MANLADFKKGGFGYSVAKTKEVFGKEKPEFILVGSHLIEVHEWDDENKRYTDKVQNLKVMVAMAGVEPFYVKLPLADENGEKTTLDGLKFLDTVVFDNFETWENGRKVFFQGTSIKKVGK